jgi:hypothetical protein
MGKSSETTSGYEEADSDGSMLDLREDLKPISAYIKDRDRMLTEMFRSIRGTRLQSMLPEVLKVTRFCFVVNCSVFSLDCLPTRLSSSSSSSPRKSLEIKTYLYLLELI